jgi:hypothetical protein
MDIQNIQDYAKAINLSWRKTTDSVLEPARLCAEADKNLPHDKNNFFKDLDFNKATFSKLVKIGSHSRLQTDPVKSLLPPNYTIVYKVAMLSRQDRHRRNVRARFSCGNFFRPAVLQDGTRSVATTHEFRSVRGLHLVDSSRRVCEYPRFNCRNTLIPRTAFHSGPRK